MTEAIICAIITGGLTLLGVIIANSKTQAVKNGNFVIPLPRREARRNSS